MPPRAGFSLLIKPASADCNLRCPYCFYLPKQALYPETPRHRMAPKVLERIVSTYLATEQDQYAFGWQGGEPTLMGAGFFRAVTRLQSRYGRPGAVVSNGLQTNGTLIDEPLARHLARYRFLVGVSLDGPAELHDGYRRSPAGSPSHARVLAGIEMLRRFGVEHNVLTLVTDRNARDGRLLYRYLADQGLLFHQYIPCVEFDAAGRPAQYAIRPDDWGRFLCQVFDEWCASDAQRVSVRLFDSILVRMVDGATNVCHMCLDCRQYLLVEHNGDVYPCDFFVDPQTRLGNIMEVGWDELRSRPAYEAFGRRKSELHAACTSCAYLSVCAGDCLKHRVPGPNDPRRLSYLCEGWKLFYAHALPELRRIADRVREMRAARPSPGLRSGTVGRNDPCPCGSGRKYKTCCGV